MRKLVLYFSSLLLLCVSSCNVLEDREHCPCILEVDLSGVMQGAVSLCVSKAGMGELHREALDKSQYGQHREYEVPRGTIDVAVFSQLDNLTESGTSLVLPYGCQMDALYAHSVSVETKGEYAYDYVVMHKQFCTITLDFGQSADYIAENFSLEADGNTAGIDFYSLEPISGTFHCIPERTNEGFVFRVPRQADNSLQLSLLKDDSVFSVFDIGSAIADAGFDWEAEDLDDVTIYIDLPTLEMSVSVQAWDSSGMGEIRF